MSNRFFAAHVLGPDTHANLPSASTTPDGAIYECTTHGKFYKNDNGTWITYGVLIPPGGGTGQVLAKASGTDQDVGWATPASAGLSDPTTTKGDVLARTSSAVARVAVGSDGQVLTADSASTAGVKWAAAGGGGGSSIKDRRWTPSTGALAVDEFNDDSIAAAWSRVDTSGHTGYIGWTEGADVLSAATGLSTDATAEMHAQVQPLSGIGGSLANGDGFITYATSIAAANYTVFGVVLATGTTVGAGSQAFGAVIGGGGFFQVARYNMTGWNTQGSYTPESVVYTPGMFIRLALISSTNYRVDVSPDGVSWVKGTLVALAGTMTHAGLVASSWGTATKGVVGFEMFRRVSGVT